MGQADAGYPKQTTGETENMKSKMMMLAALAGATALYGQNPLTTELKQTYAGIKGNVMKAADAMPDDDVEPPLATDDPALGKLISSQLFQNHLHMPLRRPLLALHDLPGAGGHGG